jgi:hypothetical protein
MTKRRVIRPYEFRLVDVSEVPSADPIVEPPTEPVGSRWDAALTALSSSPASGALHVEAQDGKDCKHLMSTLRTRANNLGIGVEVRRAGDGFYVWRVNRMGRFPPPPVDAK